MSQMKLTLTPQQQTALVVIEVQQNAMAFAAQMLAHSNVDQLPAARVLEDALRSLEAAKLNWLKHTQMSVQVVPAGALPLVSEH